MDSNVASLISSLGFPIIACIAMAYFVKYMIGLNNAHIERMFSMYDQANKENREAIEACTKAIEKLCDRLDRE